MTHLRLNLKTIKPALVNLIVGSLKVGQTIVLPTDTIYGLSCLANHSRAIKKVQRLKKRAPQKPLIVLVKGLAQLKKYVFVSRVQAEFLKKAWAPSARPTTVILKHRGRLPKELSGLSDGLAVRLPKSEFLLKIIKKADCPLVSTSLNLSGRESIHDLRHLLNYFPQKGRRPDLVIDAGKCRRQKPSRLIDLRDETHPIILRK
ncbi:TPA: threonylcarbamoyl-AMP synthase [Candidatus Falkowbacteria bacterium]|nr:MAG: YrdC/Sua5 family protein, required for threonylcarbamoyladenosine (T(6)A) formation in tRNA [Candidatus Falkowbacteria bacterium GW2011_GWF2_43_32]HBA36429.1 threonylcarbamoyl-AMP synthase [Candidatus Falkowbacteria bacterium]